MRKVKFREDASEDDGHPKKEPDFKKGEVYEMNDASAQHWVSRGKADDVSDAKVEKELAKAEKETEKAAKQAEKEDEKIDKEFEKEAMKAAKEAEKATHHKK
jgi:hypothetical protein